MKYVSLGRILAKLDRDYGLEGISEVDVIEWIGEALEFIGAVTQYEEATAFIEVKNHQACLPNGFHAIIQLARNRCHNHNDGICPTDVFACKPFDSTTLLSPEAAVPDLNSQLPDQPVALDIFGMPIQEYDLAYYRPYFDLKWEYNQWRDSPISHKCFTPIRLANNTFFNTIVCDTRQHDKLAGHSNDGWEDEYTIVQGELLRFSFQHGQIALAYLRQYVDPVTGYPMIPDVVEFTTAITEYINMKLQKRGFYKHREGNDKTMQVAEASWQWYCRQARNNAMMLKGVDQFENYMQQRNYLLPQRNAYYGFFGRLGKAESKRYNNPDVRNKYNYGGGLFRGSNLV